MSEFDRRQALRIFAGVTAAGALAPALAACAPGEVSDDELNAPPNDGRPVRIGLIVPLSGPNKPYGDEMVNGLRLYLAQSGDKLGGRPATLIVADEGDAPATAVAAADKLIKQDQVHALTGVATPAAMLALRDKIESSQVPLLGSNASPPSLVGAKYIWRTSFALTDASEAPGRWVATHAGGSVAVIAADSDDDAEVKAFTQALVDAKGRIEGAPAYTPAASTQFAGLLAAVKASPAAALFCHYSGTQAVEFVKQFKAAGFRPGFKLFAPGVLTEGYVLKQQGDAARDIYTAMNYSPDLDNPVNRRFVAEYQKAHSSIPSSYAVASYDVGAVLDKALVAVRDDLTAVAINAAIGRLGQIDSPRGPWQFNQNRGPLQRWYLRQVRPDGSALSNVLTAELTTLG